jgi:hypothetical protein
LAIRSLFSLKQILVIPLVLVTTVIVANALVRWVCAQYPFDCPTYWPLSVFYPRTPAPVDILAAALVAGLFALALWHLSKCDYRLWVVLLWGVVSVLGSNLVQGGDRAFAVSIAGDPLYWTLNGDGIEYYHDALDITDPSHFLADYERLQPDLRVHSKSHPPGAILALYGLSRVTPDPALIGMMIACISVALSAVWLYGILRAESGDHRLAGYSVFLFLVIPAVQIYFAACLDALICAALLGCLYFFAYSDWRLRGLGAAACLFAALFMSFGAAFIVPVLVGVEWCRNRSVRRSALVVGLVAALFAALYAFTGFNYAHSFQIASALENPDGFRLWAEPLSYSFTRVEDVLEILLFFGPFMTLLLLRGLRLGGNLRLFSLGIGALLAMFLTGAFRTGETARACLFFYPYLLLPVVLYLGKINPSESQQRVLLALVFGQGIIMQLFGGYFW